LLLALLATAFACFALDQWTKRATLRRAADGPVLLGRLLKIEAVAHRKEAFSREGARRLLALAWLAALAGAVLLLTFHDSFRAPAAGLGLALALGGAAGNLADILGRRCVVDFIDLGWWPVFNLADLGIVAGLLMAFWPVG